MRAGKSIFNLQIPVELGHDGGRDQSAGGDFRGYQHAAFFHPTVLLPGIGQDKMGRIVFGEQVNSCWNRGASGSASRPIPLAAAVISSDCNGRATNRPSGEVLGSGLTQVTCLSRIGRVDNCAPWGDRAGTGSCQVFASAPSFTKFFYCDPTISFHCSYMTVPVSFVS